MSKLSVDKLIFVLKNAECTDGFCCPFGMYGQNEKGKYGCFAICPHGDPDEQKEKCVAVQAAEMLEYYKTKGEKNE